MFISMMTNSIPGSHEATKMRAEAEELYRKHLHEVSARAACRGGGTGGTASCASGPSSEAHMSVDPNPSGNIVPTTPPKRRSRSRSPMRVRIIM